MIPFGAVLDHCRKTVLSEPDNEWKSFDLKIIDRWRKHHEVERAWETINRAVTRDGAASLPAEDFVAWVLEQARLQQRLADDVIPNSPDLEKKMIAAAEREWRASRNGIGAAAAGAKRDLAQLHRADRIRILGRQPNPRKRFILLCRDLFMTNCGQPLDQVTETLFELVFDEEPKPNEVRDALKATKRAARDTRKQK